MTNIATFENEAILKHKIVMVFKKNGPLLRKEVASHLGVKGLEPRRELKAFLTHLVAIGLLKKEKSKRLNLCEGNCPSLEKHYPAADILKTFEHLSGNSLKIGVFQKLNKSITALHRKNDRFKYKIPDQFCKDFEQDDVVVCVFEGQKLDHVERLGNVHDQRLFPSLGVLNAGLAFSFSKEAIEDAKKIATVPNPSKNRKDYKDLPFVTIDGEDAKDFDDAVFAQEILSKKGSVLGYKVYVAIADVSYYVPLNSDLDKEAYERGNSVYLSGCVVPMLPEILSNDLCSLIPNVNRAAFVCEMDLSSDGILKEYVFKKGVICSKARLTYNQVQDVLESKPHVLDIDLVQNTILPLFNVYKTLRAKRQDRGALDLDMPEYQAQFDEDGNLRTISSRSRLTAHELIEELMILANVAAAKTLFDHKVEGLYRVHDEPESTRLHALKETLEHFNLTLSQGKKSSVTPRQISDLLRKAQKLPQAHLIQEVILRSQAQAIYSPFNKGHFGLALDYYAHFTSPIRRYADLVVHRALSQVIKHKEGAFVYDKDSLKNMGSHLSFTERQAASCEREVLERYGTLLFEKDVGRIFELVISGVNSTGLFVKNPKTGAEGFIPVHSLDDDYYVYDSSKHRFFGRRTKRSLQVGDNLMAKLIKADPILCSVQFEAIFNSKKQDQRTKDKKSEKKPVHKKDGSRQKNFKTRSSKKKSG